MNSLQMYGILSANELNGRPESAAAGMAEKETECVWLCDVSERGGYGKRGYGIQMDEARFVSLQAAFAAVTTGEKRGETSVLEQH